MGEGVGTAVSAMIEESLGGSPCLFRSGFPNVTRKPDILPSVFCIVRGCTRVNS
jgi:hypothetical protein